MEIYQILNLDCSKKENRKRLLQDVMEVTRLDRKPTLNKLEKLVQSVGKKYNIQLQYLQERVDGSLLMSVRVGEAYQVMKCFSRYEAMCKLLLYIKAYKKYRQTKVK